MPEPQDVASRYDKRRHLWKAAIKWPMYSVAVMPVLLAAGWRLGAGLPLRWDQLFGFLLAAILLLLWENLSNDLFDADTGIDERGKPHSVINLTGRRDWVALLSSTALLLGLLLMGWLALRSSPAVLALVLAVLRIDIIKAHCRLGIGAGEASSAGWPSARWPRRLPCWCWLLREPPQFPGAPP